MAYDGPEILSSSTRPFCLIRADAGHSQQAVPTAVENGINSGPDLCILYGSHTPLDAATLAQLYGNHDAYVSAVSDVSNDNVEAGYILRDDAEANIFEAAQSGILKR